MQCMKCNGGRLSRMKRRGFIEKHVFSMMGLYPWRCNSCKEHVMLKNRGGRRRKEEPGAAYSLRD